MVSHHLSRFAQKNIVPDPKLTSSGLAPGTSYEASGDNKVQLLGYTKELKALVLDQYEDGQAVEMEPANSLAVTFDTAVAIFKSLGINYAYTSSGKPELPKTEIASLYDFSTKAATLEIRTEGKAYRLCFTPGKKYSSISWEPDSRLSFEGYILTEEVLYNALRACYPEDGEPVSWSCSDLDLDTFRAAAIHLVPGKRYEGEFADICLEATAGGVTKLIVHHGSDQYSVTMHPEEHGVSNLKPQLRFERDTLTKEILIHILKNILRDPHNLSESDHLDIVEFLKALGSMDEAPEAPQSPADALPRYTTPPYSPRFFEGIASSPVKWPILALAAVTVGFGPKLLRGCVDSAPSLSSPVSILCGPEFVGLDNSLINSYTAAASTPAYLGPNGETLEEPIQYAYYNLPRECAENLSLPGINDLLVNGGQHAVFPKDSDMGFKRTVSPSDLAPLDSTSWVALPDSLNTPDASYLFVLDGRFSYSQIASTTVVDGHIPSAAVKDFELFVEAGHTARLVTVTGPREYPSRLEGVLLDEELLKDLQAQ